MGIIIGNTECPSCRKMGRDRTGNHLILFEDGGAFCNRCGYTEKSDTFTPPKVTLSGSKSQDEIDGEIVWVKENSVIQGLPSRGLKAFACKHFGVRVGLSLSDGRTPICAYLPVQGEAGLQGFKARDLKEKKNIWIKGTGKKATFFGLDVCPPRGNKLFITEGEFDAVALYQAMYEHVDEKYRKRIAVISLPNGTGGVAQELIKQKKLIDGYKEIVLCFDQDEPGKIAVDEALTVLHRDKVRVVDLPEKDANDMVKEGLSKDLYFACITAPKPKPEKILRGSDITLQGLMTPLKRGLESGYPLLDSKLRGFRYGSGGGELTVYCAGSGIGKSSFAREIMYRFNNHYQKRIGHIFLEEQYNKTGQAYIAIDNNVPLGALREDPTLVSVDRFKCSYDKLINNDRCFFMKHWGSIDSAELMDHMWYFSKVEGCEFIFLDHISLVVSGGQSSSEGERKDLDVLMTKLAAFCEESGTSIQAIVHLKRPAHGSFNDGMKISLSHLRGSAAIEQLSHNIIGIEGNQSGGEPNTRTLRILKNREWGDIGIADTLHYSPETGRLLPARLGD